MSFILCGKFTSTLSKIKKIITDNGGSVVTDPSEATLCIIGSKPSASDTKASRKNALACVELKIPLLKEEYVSDCVENNSIVDAKEYVVAISLPDDTTTKEPPKKRKRKEEEEEQDEVSESEAPVAENSKKNKIAQDPPSAKVDVEPLQLENLEVTVDAACSDQQAKVYIENGVVYDALLNQANIGNNNNKFYINQLLVSSSGDYIILNRWGRVGSFGQSKESRFSSVEEAKHFFEKMFKAKTKVAWEARHLSEPKPGNYTMLEKDYESTSTKSGISSVKSGSTKTSVKSGGEMEASKLDIRVQQLISLIFDQSLISKQLEAMNYDDQQLPLGKLTKKHISKGYAVLKKIADVLITPVANMNQVLIDLSNEFYTLIPHRFSHSTRPKVISTTELLKSRLDMVEQLMDIEIANSLMEEVENAIASRQNMIDKQYNSLRCDIVPVDDTSTLGLIETYVKKTHGKTHGFNLKVKDVFEITRPDEKTRFDSKRQLGNVRLLWHGSRVTNFVGILSQGLRIAPPEAPVSGYMFGKGIYFADMVSKSANYCCSYLSNNEGILLLCEVALGEMNAKLQADYDAGNLPPGKSSTFGVGRTSPDFSQMLMVKIDGEDVLVPCVDAREESISGASLFYNEYIVYSVDQVRIKYLVRMQFK